MHREISHTDSMFEQDHNVALYFMTALIGVLIGLDLLPKFATWVGITALQNWPLRYFGYEPALIAAVIGGARILYSSLQSLMEGRIGADLVGVSLVPEVIAAVHAGFQVLALVGITQQIQDGRPAATSIEAMLDAAELAAPRIASVLVGVVAQSGRALA